MFTRRIWFRRVTIPTVASDSNWIDYIVASDGAIGMHGIIDIGALIASIFQCHDLPYFVVRSIRYSTICEIHRTLEAATHLKPLDTFRSTRA